MANYFNRKEPTLGYVTGTDISTIKVLPAQTIAPSNASPFGRQRAEGFADSGSPTAWFISLNLGTDLIDGSGNAVPGTTQITNGDVIYLKRIDSGVTIDARDSRIEVINTSFPATPVQLNANFGVCLNGVWDGFRKFQYYALNTGQTSSISTDNFSALLGGVTPLLGNRWLATLNPFRLLDIFYDQYYMTTATMALTWTGATMPLNNLAVNIVLNYYKGMRVI